MEIIKKLHTFSTIEEMTEWLSRQNHEFLRHHLLNEFDKVRYYETATQWNDAVKICETLAIIGWGERNRVDAVCNRRDNWRITSFRSKNDDMCFREANFLQRKAGWYLVNCTDYHAPGHPDRNKIDYTSTREEDILCSSVDTILSQQNYLVKMPFWFPGRLDHSEFSWAVAEYMSELHAILKDEFNPAPYASRLESFEIWTSVGWAKNAYKFKVGRYHAKQKSFNTSLHFSRETAKLSETKQRMVIVEGIKESIDAFTERLEKRKFDFPSSQFKADVNLVLLKFMKLKTQEKKSEEADPLKDALFALIDGLPEANKPA